MVSAELLDVLRCPLTRQAVRSATPIELGRLRDAAESGSAKTLAGVAVTLPLEEVLARADGQAWFRVEAGIPVMSPDEVIFLGTGEVR